MSSSLVIYSAAAAVAGVALFVARRHARSVPSITVEPATPVPESLRAGILNQFDMTGTVVLLTGGSGYLGTAMCQALAEVGATVIVGSREFAKAQALADSLPTPCDQKHVGVVLDQNDPGSLEKGFSDAVRACGHVDALINNGNQALAKDLTTISFEEFCEVQRNGAGYFCLARELRDHCVSRGARGAIVNIGSMYGSVASYPDAYAPGGASPVSYHFLKGGVAQMTRHLAAYWAADGIRVNTLSPGPFPNPRTAPQTLVDKLCRKLPMGRMGLPSELKGALVLLTSQAGSYLTGQNILVDGGWTAW